MEELISRPEAEGLSPRSLESQGLYDVAWTRSDILLLLQRLEGTSVCVLGGDVWEEDGGRLKPNYDSWHSERRRGESLAAYARRSRSEALAYLARYPIKNDQWFVITISDEPTAGL